MGSYAFTTNSIRFTEVAEYLLITATYRGARWASSRRHPPSATSTRRMPSEKLNARVRSATALPHATGHASKALSFAGARWRALATMVSSSAEARFKARPRSFRVLEDETDCSIGNVASLPVARPLPPQPWRAFWRACAGAPTNTDFPGSASPRRNRVRHRHHRRGCSRRSILLQPQYRAAL
jgi:hypothetical protein